jgi:hypothetical protein
MNTIVVVVGMVCLLVAYLDRRNKRVRAVFQAWRVFLSIETDRSASPPSAPPRDRTLPPAT